MVDFNEEKIYIFYDGFRASIVIGRQVGDSIFGKYRGEFMNQNIVHNNYKEELASADMRLHTGTTKEGGYKQTNARLVLVPYFLDNTSAKQAMNPAVIKNMQLKSENESLKRLNSWLRQKLFDRTGHDRFDEARLNQARAESKIRGEYYKEQNQLGGYGGYSGYRSSYGYPYSSRYGNIGSGSDSDLGDSDGV